MSEFYYNGTRWLSTTLYRADSHIGLTAGATIPYSATTAAGIRRIVGLTHYGGSDLWLEDLIVSFYVSAGTALSGSHKWVLTSTLEPSSTAGPTYSITSGSLSTWRNGVVTIDALIGSDFELDVTWTKTGTPGNLFAFETLTYRVVAT